MWDHGKIGRVTVTISSVSDIDSGEYWCTVPSSNGMVDIFEKVKFWVINASGFEGNTINISCKYPNMSGAHRKYFLRGKDPKKCLEQEFLSKSRFSSRDIAADFTVTISNLTAEDAGIYWCVVISDTSGPEFTSAVQITVEKDLSHITVPVAVSLAVVALLIVMVILIVCRKRRSKTGDRGMNIDQDTPMMTMVQTKEEDKEVAQTTNNYEAVKNTTGASTGDENPGTPLTTTSATAYLSTSPTDTAYLSTSPTDTVTYSSVSFQKSAAGRGVPGGEDLTAIGDHACEYAHVKYSAIPK
ncbi:polymeric immunoglobulin receptor-like [Sardina pilchardus]|uniref:polymeric immunoglobulin receptor-like n=1 Tax=Sardina pilchardus TaxID=27697 RepID=UPI002E0F72CE